MSNIEINLSQTFSTRHYETITDFRSNFKHADSYWKPMLSGKMALIIPARVSPGAHSGYRRLAAKGLTEK